MPSANREAQKKLAVLVPVLVYLLLSVPFLLLGGLSYAIWQGVATGWLKAEQVNVASWKLLSGK